MFIPLHIDILKTAVKTSTFTAWKSKGFFDESIKLPSTSDNSLNPGINYSSNPK